MPLAAADREAWQALLSQATLEDIAAVTALTTDPTKLPSASAARIRAVAARLEPRLAPMIATPTLILKTYSTYPAVGCQLTDSNGNINLTTATSVKFVMKGITSSTVVTGAATVVTASSGIVSYAWGSTDTDQADSYQVEWAITWTGGPPTQIQIVPNAAANNQVIEIDADLDAGTG